jgi:F0F1-type ATP synthase membrane subunit b/b'
MSNEGALRRKVEETTAEVATLRAKFHNGDEKAGKKLPKAREQASAALQALWDACPGEKPPTQRVF